tara:strand:+ start:92 stop:271 length:180 start_codon:yes stop_codon:yes gene_type:complete
MEELNINEILYLQMIVGHNLTNYIEDDSDYLKMIHKLNNKLTRIKNHLNNVDSSIAIIK